MKNRQKRFSAATVFNFLGLGAAFAVAIVVAIFARHEYSYDDFHENRERIFQLENQRTDGVWESNFSRPNVEMIIGASPHIVAGGIQRGYTKGENTTWAAGRNGEQEGVRGSVIWINPGFGEVFRFRMISGSVEAIKRPDGVIIPRSMEEKLFGGQSAIGRQIFSEMAPLGNEIDFYGSKVRTSPIVGGVYEDFPDNSRLANAVYAPVLPEDHMTDWYSGMYYAYVLLDSPEAAGEVERAYKEKNAELMERLGITDIRLVPLGELYFRGNVRYDSTPAGNKTVTNTLLMVAMIVIVVAAINFVNLSIAQTSTRMKSINTRKVLGCSVESLRREIVVESVVFMLCAFVFAVAVVAAVGYGGVVRQMFGFEVRLAENVGPIVAMAILAVVAGVMAGLYPARYMTTFPTVMALKGSYSPTGRARSVRKVLTGFQYAVSFTLISGAIFIFIQNRYVGRVDMGFEKENLLEVKLPISVSLTKTDLYRERLVEHPGIEDVAFCQEKFVHDESKTSVGYLFEGKHDFQYWLRVSENFPEVMGMRFTEGRGFRRSDAVNPDRAVCIVSETVARAMGCGAGDRLLDDGREVEIVGVFEEVHFESLLKPIEPLGLWVCAPDNNYRNNPFFYSYARVGGGDIEGAVRHIGEVMDELAPGYPIEVRFFDERLEELYAQTRRQGAMVTVFCAMAVLISIMGVFGLVTLETRRRRKEIALRKTLGSRTRDILTMINGEYLSIALIGFAISIPVTLAGVKVWLEGFEERTPLHWWVFGISLVALVALTTTTVTMQAMRPAQENPINAIKAE